MLGITRCSILDWAIQGAFVIISVSVTFSSIRGVRREQILKEKYGLGLVESDIRF